MSELTVLRPPDWDDYELLDSGDGAKLERYGPYLLDRPEQQAIWRRALGTAEWERADATFDRAAGRWTRAEVPPRWQLRWGPIRFWVELTPFRHTGVFPEQAANWAWIWRLIEGARRPIRVLNLFGYTGLATLVAAAAGASVTHVDASKPAIGWARENQGLSDLDDRPIRWLLDDALKFVRREVRRGNRYEGIILDPPVFGRGPRGEVWRFYTSFPPILEACRQVLSPDPLFFLINAYAVEASALMLRNVLLDALHASGLQPDGGSLAVGELVLAQRALAPDGPGGTERLLSTGIFGRWSREAPGREPRGRGRAP